MQFKRYIDRNLHRIRHRRGHGVHSPFAYDVITQVIEERHPYYAYGRMEPAYRQAACPSIPLKTACLLLRLANRFQVRQTVEIGSDCGSSILPLLLADRRNEVVAIASSEREEQIRQHLHWAEDHLDQLQFPRALADVRLTLPTDMIVISEMPADLTPEQLATWMQRHTHERSILFVCGIRNNPALASLWSHICASQDIAITMDLYDYGLAIRRPRFFKQHYTVGF